MRAATSVNDLTDQNLQGISSNGSPYVLNYSSGRGGVSYLQPSQSHPSCYPSLSLYQSACPPSSSASNTDDVSLAGNRCVSTIINAGSGVLIRTPHIPVYYLQQQQQQQPIHQHQPQHSLFFQQQQQQQYKYIQQHEQNAVQLGSYSGESPRQLVHPHQETGHPRINDDPRIPAAPSAAQFELLAHQPPLHQVTKPPQNNQTLQRPLQRDTVLISQREAGSGALDQCRNLALGQGLAASNGNTNDACKDQVSSLRDEGRSCQFLSSSCSFSGIGIKESSSDGVHRFTGQPKENVPGEDSSTKKSDYYRDADGFSNPHNCLVCKVVITCVAPKSRQSVTSEQPLALSVSLPTEATSSNEHCQPERVNVVRGIPLDENRLSTSNSLSLSLLEKVLRIQVSSSKTSIPLSGKENQFTTSSSFDKKKNSNLHKDFDDCSNENNDVSGAPPEGPREDVYAELHQPTQPNVNSLNNDVSGAPPEGPREDVYAELHQPTQPNVNSSNLTHGQPKSPLLSNPATSMDVVCLTCWEVMERIDELEHVLTSTKRILVERHLNNFAGSDAPSACTQSLVVKSKASTEKAKLTNARAKCNRRYSKPVIHRTPKLSAGLPTRDQAISPACSRGAKTLVTGEWATEGDASDEVSRRCGTGHGKQGQSDSEEQPPDAGEEENPDDPDFGHKQRVVRKRGKDNKRTMDNQSEINAMIEFIGKKKRKSRRPPPQEAPVRPPADTEDRRCSRCAKLVPAGTFIRHLYQHKLAPCPFCHTCYATTELKLHLLSAHREHRSFPCLECAASYSSYRHLRVHHLTEHVGVSPVRPVSCRVCKSLFSSPSAARRHVQSVHLNSAAYRCQHCDETFNQKGNLENHVRRVHRKDSSDARKNCICEVCDKRFEYPCDVREHLEKVHLNVNTKTSVCEICGKSFADSRSVKTHINAVHTKAIKYPCPYCKIIFHSQTNMTSHKRRMHEAQSRKYKCDVCMKGFCNPSSVTTHKQVVHEKLVRFTCDICQQGFKVGSQLKYHRRKHTGECPYQCPHCYKSFPGPSHIANHVRKVHKTIYVGANQRRKLNLTEAAPPPPPGILLSRESRPKASTSNVAAEEKGDGGSSEVSVIGLPCEYNQRNSISDVDKASQEGNDGRNTETLQIVPPHHVVTLAQGRPETSVNALHAPRVDPSVNISGHNPHTFEYLQQQHHHSVFVHPQQLQFNQQSGQPEVQQLSQPSNHDSASQVMNQHHVLQSGQVSATTLVGGAIPGVAAMEVVGSYPTGQYEQVSHDLQPTVVRLVHDVQFGCS